MRRSLAALMATGCVLLVSGCSDNESDATVSTSSEGLPTSTPSQTTSAEASPSESATVSAEPSAPPTEDAGHVIKIVFDGDSVKPNGDRVEVKAGEPITLQVTADKPGEIHVHSNPEQELEYDAGESTLSLTIDQPGIVEVESHGLGKVIVQLEVRP